MDEDESNDEDESDDDYEDEDIEEEVSDSEEVNSGAAAVAAPHHDPEPLATQVGSAGHEELLGVAIEKNFPGYGRFYGRVVESLPGGKYRVVFTDREEKKMAETQVQRLRDGSAEATEAVADIAVVRAGQPTAEAEDDEAEAAARSERQYTIKELLGVLRSLSGGEAAIESLIEADEDEQLMCQFSSSGEICKEPVHIKASLYVNGRPGDRVRHYEQSFIAEWLWTKEMAKGPTCSDRWLPQRFMACRVWAFRLPA